MKDARRLQKMFEDLAKHFAKQDQPRHRDHCWVLAADAALTAENISDADLLRLVLLKANPHHLLRPFANMADAMKSADVREYLTDLRMQWPADHVEAMWRQLGLDQKTPTSLTESTLLPKPTPPVGGPPSEMRPKPQKNIPPAIAKAILGMEPKKPDKLGAPPMPKPTPTQPHPPLPTRATPKPPSVYSADAEPPAANLPPDHGVGPALQHGLATFVFLLGIAATLGILFLALIWPIVKSL